MPAGKELVLRCPAAASPSPSITWMKDGRRFDERLVGQVSQFIQQPAVICVLTLHAFLLNVIFHNI